MTTKWRYRCPDGHCYSSVRKNEQADERYYCIRCDKRFGELWDGKEEQYVCRFNNE